MADPRLAAQGWRWRVRSYARKLGDDAPSLVLETIHRSDASKDIEVGAAEALGRTVEVEELK